MDWDSVIEQELMEYHENRLANMPDYDSNESSESSPNISFETSFDEDQFELELYASNKSLFESANADSNIELETNQGEQNKDKNCIELEVNNDENEVIGDKENDESNQSDGEIDKDLCTICLEEIEEDMSRLVCDHVYHRNCIQQWFQKIVPVQFAAPIPVGFISTKIIVVM